MATEGSFHRSLIGKGWVRFRTEHIQMGKSTEKESYRSYYRGGGGSRLNLKTRNTKKRSEHFILNLCCVILVWSWIALGGSLIVIGCHAKMLVTETV